jgi:hypothetical protein
MSTPIVELRYSDLVSTGIILIDEISEAFSADGNGILIVSGVPGYAEARQQLLPLARDFAKLDTTIQDKYVHSASYYSFGWSHGKEKLQGRPDLSKGSFYANPQYDRPVDDENVIAQFPSFVHPNIWPTDDLPSLEPAFKDLGQMIVSVGLLVAKQCDLYIQSRSSTYKKNLLHSIISESKCCKARILHYYPINGQNTNHVEKGNRDLCNSNLEKKGDEIKHNVDEDFSSWCGWHNDHGSLTGLTSAMLLNEDGDLVTESDDTAGIYMI